MTQTATVRRLLPDGQAEVVVERGTACGGNCGACGGCAYKNSMFVTAGNPIQALPGDRVLLSTRSSRVLLAAVILYILPFVLFFIAYGVTAAAAASESTAILVSLGALALGLLLARFYDRRVRRRRNISFEITAFADRR